MTDIKHRPIKNDPANNDWIAVQNDSQGLGSESRVKLLNLFNKTRRFSYENIGDFYQISPGEVIFNPGATLAAGVSLAGATGVKSDNAAIKWFAESTSTIDVTNNGGSGATLNVSHTLPVARAAMGVAPSLLVPIWVEDYTQINTVKVRLSMGDATFANSYDYTYAVSNSGSNILKKNGWHLVSVGASDWVATGTVDWATQTINAIRFSFVNKSGGNASRILIDKIKLNNRAKAKVLLMTDGTYAEQWNFSRRVLNALGLRATFSVTPGEPGGAGKMTLAQIESIANDGHAVCPRNSTALNTLTADQAVANVAAAQDYLRSILGSVGEEGAKFITYANGIYYASGATVGDMTVVNRLAAELGIVGGRTTEATNSAGYMILGADNYPPNIMTAPILGAWTGNTLAALKANIDTAIERGAAVCYFNHAPQNVAGSIESTELVRQFYEYVALKKSQGLIDDVTWPEFYYGM